jgi:hypothetical protein
MMVLDMFWILLHTMQTISEDADQDLYRIKNSEGKQGSMDFRGYKYAAELNEQRSQAWAGIMSV